MGVEQINGSRIAVLLHAWFLPVIEKEETMLEKREIVFIRRQKRCEPKTNRKRMSGLIEKETNVGAEYRSTMSCL
jgi:hypothetical protein